MKTRLIIASCYLFACSIDECKILSSVEFFRCDPFITCTVSCQFRWKTSFPWQCWNWVIQFLHSSSVSLYIWLNASSFRRFIKSCCVVCMVKIKLEIQVVFDCTALFRSSIKSTTVSAILMPIMYSPRQSWSTKPRALLALSSLLS